MKLYVTVAENVRAYANFEDVEVPDRLGDMVLGMDGEDPELMDLLLPYLVARKSVVHEAADDLERYVMIQREPLKREAGSDA